MNYVAEGQGLEPRFTGPEPVVLPLDDPSIIIYIIKNMGVDWMRIIFSSIVNLS